MTDSFRPKILFLGTQMAVGGAQLLLLNKAAWFQERGYDVEAAFFYDHDDMEIRWQQHYTFSIENLKGWDKYSSVIKKPALFLIGMLRLIIKLINGKYDIIETYTPHASLIGLPTAWLVRIPVRVGSHHGILFNSSKWVMRAHAELYKLGIATGMIAVSSDIKEKAIQAEKIPAKKVELILNGIEVEKFNIDRSSVRSKYLQEFSFKEQDFLIINTTRIVRQKGHIFLFQALRIMQERGYSFKMLIAGEGPLINNLSKKAESWGIMNHIQFLGNRDDIPELLAASDLFVLSSLWEGLSLSLMEAMAAGLPIITSNVEGVNDCISHGETGIVFEIGDVEELSNAIMDLIDNPGKREKLGRMARKKVQDDFSADTMMKKYEKYYLESLSEKSNFILKD